MTTEQEIQKLLYNVSDADCVHWWSENNVTEKMVKEGEIHLRDWYNKQPHLPKNALSPEEIRGIFANSKFRIEVAKKYLDDFFSVRNVLPELFANRDPLSKPMVESMEFTQFFIMPKLTPERYRILLVRAMDADMTTYNFLNVWKNIIYIHEMNMRYDMSNGYIVILDTTHLKAAYILKNTSPVIIIRTFQVLQRCFPIRWKGIHFINFPSMAMYIVNMIKAVLPPKLGDRMYFHKNIKELTKAVPSQYLPVEYGGTEFKSAEISDRFVNIIKSDLWRQRFIEAENLKSNELLRPGKSDWMNEFQGTMGSFRKLDID